MGAGVVVVVDAKRDGTNQPGSRNMGQSPVGWRRLWQKRQVHPVKMVARGAMKGWEKVALLARSRKERQRIGSSVGESINTCTIWKGFWFLSLAVTSSRRRDFLMMSTARYFGKWERDGLEDASDEMRSSR